MPLTTITTQMRFSNTQGFVVEFSGVLILTRCGCASAAMVVLFANNLPRPVKSVVKGHFTDIALGWGPGVTLGIYSAGHDWRRALNPAAASKRCGGSRTGS